MKHMKETTETQKRRDAEAREHESIDRAPLRLCVSVSLWFLTSLTVFAILLWITPDVFAQGRGGGGGRGGGQRGGQGGQRAARPGAPIDLTGYWVSIVTEDWRFRMVTPPKGDYDSV